MFVPLPRALRSSQPVGVGEKFCCLQCGYDLSGHQGDPRRCPECGWSTSRADLMRAFLIGQRGVPAFDAPVIPCLLFLLMVLLAGPMAAMITLGSYWPTVIGAFAAAVVGWLCGVLWFMRRFRRVSDRIRFLAHSHVFCVAALGFPPLMVAGLLALLTGSVVDGAWLSGVGSALLAASYWTYRYTKRRLPAFRLGQATQSSCRCVSLE